MHRTARIVAAAVLGTALTFSAVPADAATPKIVLIAKGANDVHITWAANGTVAQIERDGTWKKVVSRHRGTYYSVAAFVNGDTETKVSCTVRTSTGKVVRHRTASGKFASVRCDYTTKY